MSQMPEPYLVAAVKRGDLKAYEQLFMHYYPIVRAFVLGFVKIDEQAKDIAQDVFMKLWQYRESLDAAKPIKPYIFLLARREVCSYFRNKQTVMERNFSGGGIFARHARRLHAAESGCRRTVGCRRTHPRIDAAAASPHILDEP